MRWYHMVLFFLPFFFFISGYWVVAWIVKEESFGTPSLVGLSLVEAATQVSDKQLNIRIMAQRDDPSLAPGTVLDQVPLPGKKIKPHQPVFVLVSRQPDKMGAPQLCGMERRAAEARAQELKIRLKIKEIDHAEPASTIVAQSPTAGTALSVPPVMTLYVSTGRDASWHLMPSLVGRSAREVEQWCAGKKIRCVRESGADVADGVVISQRPLQGSLIESGKPLTIYLAIGVVA